MRKILVRYGFILAGGGAFEIAHVIGLFGDPRLSLGIAWLVGGFAIALFGVKRPPKLTKEVEK